MQLVVFGATGRTGRHVVNIALEKGYQVTAIVRNPAAVSAKHPNLQVVQGNLMQPASFGAHMQGKHAVISCIGSDSLKPTTLYSQGIQNILAGMEPAGVKRVMAMSASAVVVSPKMNLLLRFFTKYILQRILKNPYTDTRLMEKILQHSNTNWTIARPPRLTNKTATGRYRYAINSFLEKCLSITREDLARFMVDNLTNPETYCGIIEVAN